MTSEFQLLGGCFPCQGLALDGQEVLAPNQDIVTLDAAHASRRFLSRTFKSDDTMARILDDYILGSQSVTSIIANSPHLTDIFTSCVKILPSEDSIPGDAFNVGVAKHRFNSISKRLGRFVGKLCAIFQTAEKIRHLRHGKEEARQAEQFLAKFSEEDYVMLAMMADAADEAYVFTAYCDDEEADTSLQADEVAAFPFHGWSVQACSGLHLLCHRSTQAAQSPEYQQREGAATPHFSLPKPVIVTPPFPARYELSDLCKIMTVECNPCWPAVCAECRHGSLLPLQWFGPNSQTLI